MTRRKKTRSLADKVSLRTGRRKDYKQWRHENPDQAGPSKRFAAKKQKQRKLQAQRRLARQQNAPDIEIHPATKGSPDNEGTR
ncbi:hypothetical protein P1P91_07395 [Halomonas piscis]|uniref:DUF2986 domain-containing protein n=1 Tax=Halomonas piscis TaxID=3031727 RepID=A0ABY9Z419_9GAMM|nr:hypothetical protein [Halomonas piscis]WNK21485.1 hypothetical protein P1P91_07395 [Halomonas piscis]